MSDDWRDLLNREIFPFVEYEGYEGIRCQRLVDALESARTDGSVELDRIADAAAAANEKGLLTDEECAKFQVQP